MDTNRSPRAMRIFEQLIELPPEGRAAGLDELCVGDAELRALVEAMLVADAQAEEPFGGDAAKWQAELQGQSAAEAATTAQLGKTIGAWRIVGELGRGGMGTVYTVQRSDGAYAQKAALKLIRSASDSPAARERFVRERQLLAQLRHPHIATLLDGGFSADGDPYFVMEYIDGMPIDQWCDKHQLGLRERIELFLQALDAVSCAHRSLVIHRDLKPSNLMVDADGRVKLLDFGIAKQLDGSEVTATSDRALTFEYASPEQLHAAPITTATDVWQLGIVLHRLLSGAHPFGLQRDTPLPQQLQLLEREPEPLTRAAAQAPAELAVLRGGLSPELLANNLRGPLTQIVQGCLRRMPEGRYVSVDALAEDLRRWLTHRPLRIVPPTRALRFRLWWRRNLVLATAASLVLLSVLGGSGAALWQAREARAHAAIAEQQRIEAERQSANAREAMAFLSDTLAAAAPENALSTEVSVRQLLDHARAKLDERGAVDPQVRQAVQRLLGHLYNALGEQLIARELLEAGLAGLEPRSREEALALAEDHAAHAFVLGAMDLGEESLAAAEQAAALRRRFAPDDPMQQFKALEALGYAHHRARNVENAEELWLQAIELAKGVPEFAPSDLTSVINVYQMLSKQSVFTGDFARALQLADDALALAESRGLSPQSPMKAGLLQAKSQALSFNGNAAAAEPVIREAIAIHTKTVGTTGNEAGSLHGELGIVLNELGRYREAIEEFDREHQLRAASVEAPLQRAINLTNRGAVYENAGDYPRALASFEESLAILDENGVGKDEARRRQLERNYARGLSLAGRFADADALLRRLQAAARRLDGEDSAEYALLTWNRVVLARYRGDTANGLRLLDEAKGKWAELVPDTHPVVTQAFRHGAAFARQRGDFAAAERDQREAVRRFEAGAVPVMLATARAELAAIRFERGDRAEARALLEQAMPVLRDAVLPLEVNRKQAEVLARKLGV